MKTLVSFFLFCILIAGNVGAVPVYKWEDIVQLAAKNNADVKAAEEALKAVEFQEGVARSWFLPSITGNLEHTQSDVTMNSTNAPSQLTSTYSSGLTLNQNLFAGFQDVAKVRQSRANAEVSRANLRAVKARVGFELRQAFAEYTFGRDFDKETESMMIRREDGLKIVQLRYENGRENKGSIFLFQAYLEEARFDQLEARNRKKIARAKLAQLMGFDEFEEFEIEGNIVLKDPPSKPDFKALVLDTPEYIQVSAQETVADQALTVARAPFFPSVNLTATLGNRDDVFWPNKNERWNVGVNLSIPFFSGGRDYYGAKSAFATYRQASRARENQTRALRSKLEDTYYNYVLGESKLRYTKSYRDAVTVRSDVAKRQYQSGLINFNDWDWIEGDYMYRTKKYYEARRDRAVTEAAWEQALGLTVIP